ncbi:hypothetical protein P7C70_g6175, partial [Phenoliferia sp. Uapishka_3]
MGQSCTLPSDTHTILMPPSLPLENWLAIFGELSCQDLKRLASTSRTFKRLVEDRSLDRLLFRGAPTSTLPMEANMKAHPILSSNKLRNYRVNGSATIVGNLEVASAFATSPSVKSLILIHPMASPTAKKRRILRTEGVQVRDIFDALGGYGYWGRGWRRWKAGVDGDGQVYLQCWYLAYSESERVATDLSVPAFLALGRD